MLTSPLLPFRALSILFVFTAFIAPPLYAAPPGNDFNFPPANSSGVPRLLIDRIENLSANNVTIGEQLGTVRAAVCDLYGLTENTPPGFCCPVIGVTGFTLQPNNNGIYTRDDELFSGQPAWSKETPDRTMRWNSLADTWWLVDSQPVATATCEPGPSGPGAGPFDCRPWREQSGSGMVEPDPPVIMECLSGECTITSTNVVVQSDTVLEIQATSERQGGACGEYVTFFVEGSLDDSSVSSGDVFVEVAVPSTHAGNGTCEAQFHGIFEADDFDIEEEELDLDSLEFVDVFARWDNSGAQCGVRIDEISFDF